MAGYEFDLPVSAEQLQAIGMVATEWSYLESVVDAAIWTLAQVSDEDIGAAITTHLNLEARLDMLVTLVRLAADNSSAPPTHVTELLIIRKVIDALSTSRAEAIHGRWVRGDYGSPLTYIVQARGKVKRRRRGITAEEIRGIAARIAEQSRKLRTLLGIPEGS